MKHATKATYALDTSLLPKSLEMKFVLAVCLFFSVAYGAGAAPHRPLNRTRQPYALNKYIIGGTEVMLGQIPFTVAIQPVDGKLDFCGGSVVHSRWVLTAGQCVDGVAEFLMNFGSRYRGGSPYGTYMESKRAVLHDDYRYIEDPEDPTGQTYLIENDIALIQLPRHLIWTKNIQPVSLPNRGMAITRLVGETVQVSGWGWTQYDIPEMAPILRFINLVIIKNEQCEQGFGLGEGLRPKIEPFHICTDTRNDRSIFIGDIGGPMTWQDPTGANKQVGIVSFTREDGNGPVGYPNGFTRVSSYLDWIEAVTGMEIEP